MGTSNIPYYPPLQRANVRSTFPLPPKEYNDDLPYMMEEVKEYEPSEDEEPIIEQFSSEKGFCSLGGKCNNKDLLPVLDPKFNMRESAKQIVLLEDHLSHYRKRCLDCIHKHCLFIEGLLEEAITLDKKGEYVSMLSKLVKDFKNIEKELEEQCTKSDGMKNNQFFNKIQQRLRAIRKPLMNDSEVYKSGF